MNYTMNEPMPELPFDPEDWRGSDEWAEREDIRRRIDEEIREAMMESWLEKSE